ncbi:MAG: hypothetical protein QOG54_2689 [Actinomycetota bacterium]|nr:hypothetical protein [Actinomycetota bacterium]
MSDRRAFAAIVAPGVFVTSWVVAGAIRPGYDPVTDAISRLAELGAPNRWIVTTGMVTFGLGCLVFAPVLRSASTAGAVAIVIAGFASFGVAAFPCTHGCPGPDGFDTNLGHVIAAGVHYIAFCSVPFLVARVTTGRYRSLSLVAGFCAALALGAHVTGLGPNGLFQRIGLTILDLWLVLTGLRAARSMGFGLGESSARNGPR